MPGGVNYISFDSSRKDFIKQYQLLSKLFIGCDAISRTGCNSLVHAASAWKRACAQASRSSGV
jgi:hypothetical protein